MYKITFVTCLKIPVSPNKSAGQPSHLAASAPSCNVIAETEPAPTIAIIPINITGKNNETINSKEKVTGKYFAPAKPCRYIRGSESVVTDEKDNKMYLTAIESVKGNDYVSYYIPATISRFDTDTLKIDVIKEDGFPMPEWSVEAHKEFMAEAKIDYTVLSPSTPHVYNGDNKKAREVARKVNQSIAKVCRENPDSFCFVACVPLPDVKGAIEETKYAMDKLGAVGVKLSTNNYGVYLGDKSFEPLMAELNARKALVILHPARARERPENVGTGKLAAIYEYPADTPRAVINMMANKVMTMYKNQLPDLTAK